MTNQIIKSILVKKPKQQQKTILSFNRKDKDIYIFSQKGLRASLALHYCNQRVPSTLLGRWASKWLQEDLRKLKSNAYFTLTEDNFYDWTHNDNAIYGLGVKANGDVIIDDSIGMKSVVDILTKIGYTVEVDFNVTTNKCNSITLIKE